MRRSRMLQKALSALLTGAVLAVAVPLPGMAAPPEQGALPALEQAPPVPNISKFSTASWDAGWYRMETDLQPGDSVYSFDYNTTGQEIQNENPDDYRLATLPDYLRGSDYIVTRRAERREVFFMAERDITVYAALDAAYGGSVSWESGWNPTGDTLSTNDGTVYHLYSKAYAAGTQVRIKKLGSDTDKARNYFLMILPTEGKALSQALTSTPVLPVGETDPAHSTDGDYRYYINDVYNRDTTDDLPQGYTATGAGPEDRAALSGVEQPAVAQGNLAQNVAYTSENTAIDASVVDGNRNSYWEGRGFPGSVTVDLGAEKAVNRLVLQVKDTWDDRLQTVEVKGSADGQAFTTLSPAAEMAFLTAQDNTAEVTFPTAITRYLQVVVTANTGGKGGQIGELEVYGPDRGQATLVAGTNLARGCPFTVSSDNYQGQSPVDGDPTTYWRSAEVNNGPETLTVDLERELLVNRVDVRLWPRWGDRCQTLEIQGSRDGITFTTLVPATDYAFAEKVNTASIPFAETALRYIRVVGTANTGDTGIQIGELEVYGPEQAVTYAGNRLLELTKAADDTPPLTLTRQTETPVTGQVVLETRVQFDHAAGMTLLAPRTAAGDTLLALQQGEDGRLKLVTGHTTQDLADAAANTWHTLRMVLDLDAGQGEVWVDHLRRAQQVTFAPGGITAVAYQLPQTGQLQVDYIKLYDNTVQYVVEDMFDGQKTGDQPAGWQVSDPSGTAIAEIPFPADKSLHMQANAPLSATRTFAPVRGDVTVEVKVKPMTAGWITAPLVTDEAGRVAAKIAFYHNSIFVSNGQNWVYLCNQEVPHNYYEVGNWFWLKLVMNTDTGRYDVYIDGARRYSGAAFAEEVKAVSAVRFGAEQAGELYVDSVRVYDSDSLARGLMPQEHVYNVKDFGAAGDGKTNDTAAIARAVEEAAGTGGTVLLENGVFYTGQITLKSDMTLFIAPTATLYADPDRHAYNKVVPSNGYNGNRQLGRSIIYFENAKNVRVTGGGTIFGNGFYAYNENDPSDQRPCVLYFAHAQDVVIEDIHIVQSPFWTVVPYECAQVTVRRVNITNHTAPNRDGIDPVNTQKMTIEDCCIFAGDDAICPKSGNQVPLADIEVRGCLLQSDCNGIKIGTDTQGPVSNLSFEDIHIKKVGLSGLTIQSIDGSDIAHIRFKRIDMNDVDNALFVCIGNRYRLPVPNPGYAKKLGSIRDLVFEDIRFTNPMDHPYSQKGGDDIHEMMLIGLNPAYNTIQDGLEHRIQDVLFKNVYLEMPGGATTVPAFTEGISNGYPEHDALKTSAGWAYTLRWADNVRFVNCRSVAAQPDVRPEIAWADGAADPAQQALLAVINETEALRENPRYPQADETLRQTLDIAFAGAMAAYEDNNAVADTIGQAATALQAALKALEAVVPVDKDALRQAVESPVTDLEAYTTASADAYREALAAAAQILAHNAATQGQVNAALKALLTAAAALEINDPVTATLSFSQTNGVYTKLQYGTMFFTNWKTGDNAPVNMAGTAANGANKNMALYATVTFTGLREGMDVATAWKKISFRLRSSWVDGKEKAARFYDIASSGVSLDPHNTFSVCIPLADMVADNINWGDVRELNVTCEVNEPYRLPTEQDSPDITLTLSDVRIAAMVQIVDRTALQAAINRAGAIDETAYTPDSVADLRTALQAAVQAAADKDATQEQIDAAAKALAKALDALVKKPVYDRLQALIAQADLLVESDYTAASWAAMATRLADAQRVAADPEATQAAVDAAANALENALKALVKQTEPKPGVIYGDLDYSQTVTAADALLALQAATGKITLNVQQITAANVDGSRDAGGVPTVTAGDALLILQRATQKIARFPVEERL